MLRSRGGCATMAFVVLAALATPQTSATSCTATGTSGQKKSGKVLVTNLANGKVTVYDPNDDSWKVFTSLRDRISGDDHNWAAGNLVQDAAGESLYAISQCSDQSNCTGANSIIKINASSGHAVVLPSQDLRQLTLYDMAMQGSNLLVTTSAGVKKVNPADGSLVSTYWANESSWRKAEIEVVSNTVFVLLYAISNTSHESSSCTSSSAAKPSGAALYRCDALATTCSTATATKVISETQWGFSVPGSQPSPQSFALASASQAFFVEREGSGMVSSSSSSSPLDVMIVLDGSGSIYPASQWTLCKDAGEAILNALHTSVGCAMQAGVVQFSGPYQQNIEVPLTKDIPAAITAMRSISQFESSTYYSGGLVQCYNEIHNNGAQSSNAFKVCVFVTDGVNNDNNGVQGLVRPATYCSANLTSGAACTVASIADDMKAQGYHLFGIGVGSGMSSGSSPRNLLALTSCCPTYASCSSLSNSDVFARIASCEWMELITDFAAFKTGATALGNSLASMVPVTLPKVSTMSAKQSYEGVHRYDIGGSTPAHTQIVAASSQSPQFNALKTKAQTADHSFDFMSVSIGPFDQSLCVAHAHVRNCSVTLSPSTSSTLYLVLLARG